jgi:hypothetical protein
LVWVVAALIPGLAVYGALQGSVSGGVLIAAFLAPALGFTLFAVLLRHKERARRRRNG